MPHGNKGNVAAQKRRARMRARFRRGRTDTTLISIRVPNDLLDEMSEIREDTGVSVTFQMVKATREYLERNRGEEG